MINFYTSYYANMENIPKDFIKVSISGDIPDDIKKLVDIHDKRLAPNWDLFKEYKNSPQGKDREVQYIKRFKKEIIEIIDLDEIIKSWDSELKNDKIFVLLCYESNEPENSFCHRRIVAEAIENKYKINVKELGLDYDNYEINNYRVQIKGNMNDEEW